MVFAKRSWRVVFIKRPGARRRCKGQGKGAANQGHTILIGWPKETGTFGPSKRNPTVLERGRRAQYLDSKGVQNKKGFQGLRFKREDDLTTEIQGIRSKRSLMVKINSREVLTDRISRREVLTDKISQGEVLTDKISQGEVLTVKIKAEGGAKEVLRARGGARGHGEVQMNGEEVLGDTGRS